LFGDAVAAAVVRGKGGTGISLERNASYLIPNTEEWISYAVRSTGFHFQLDRRVPGTMEPLAPVLRELVTGAVEEGAVSEPFARPVPQVLDRLAGRGGVEAAEQVAAPAPGSPEARAPITTEYVRGQGKGKKRRKRR
jgi:hypothetical protein